LIQELPYEGANPGVRLTHLRRGSCAADCFICSDRLTRRRADNGTRYQYGPDQQHEEVKKIDQKSYKEKNKENFYESDWRSEAILSFGERRPAFAA
jgi:hypothetical protein